MKTLYQPLTKGSFLFLSILFVLSNSNCAIGQVFFQRDFNDQLAISNYVAPAVLNNNKFTALVVANPSSTISAVSGALVFTTNSSSTSASYARIGSLSATAPTALQYSFDLSVTYSAAGPGANSGAIFYVGNNFSNTNGVAAAASTFGRFSVDYVAGNQFQLHDLSSNLRTNTGNGGPFGGTKTITWLMNKTGGTITYTDPNGFSETLLNNKMDIWVGSGPSAVKVFNDIVAVSPTNDMQQLKFLISGVPTYSASVTLDNINIKSLDCNLTATVSTTNVTCPSGTDGTATASPSGGTGYTYLWPAGGQTTQTITGLGTGTYSVTIFSTDGCTTTAIGTVGQNVDVTAPTISCSGNMNNVSTDPGYCSATITVTTPTVADNCAVADLYNDYNYSNTLTDIFPEGTITVIWTVTDNSGNTNTCSQDITVVDAESPVIDCSMGSQTRSANNTGCSYMASDGEFDVPAYDNCYVETSYTLSGVTTDSSPYSYYTTLDNVVFNSGTTTVTWFANDYVNPVQSCSFDVTVDDNNLSAVATFDPLLCNTGTTTATLTPGGGGGGYSYLWNNGQTNPTATGLIAGTYNVTVTDIFDCSVLSNTVTITNPVHTGTDWYVNDNSNVGNVNTTTIGNDANIGTPDCPFATINHAIAMASVGDVIHVDPGTYNENVVLTKRLTIQGEGNSPTGTVIQSSAGSTPVILVTGTGANAGTRLIVDNVRVSGATGGASGISVQSASSMGYMTFSNVVSINNNGSGLAFGSTADVTDIIISNSTLSNNDNAGLRIATSVPSFNGLDVIGCTINSNGNMGFDYNPSGNNTNIGTNFGFTNTNFSNNNTLLTNNSPDVSFNHFNGNATLTNVNVVSNGAKAYAILFTGKTPSSASGTVSLNGVTCSGTVTKGGINFQIYTNVSGISLNNVDVKDITAPWGQIILDHTNANMFNLGNTKVKTIAIWNTGGADATAADFYHYISNSLLNKATLADCFQIEDQIAHKIDYSPLGFVSVNANNDYVTANSFASPYTTTPSIQRGVDAASSGWTVNVNSGTYTESIIVNKDVTLLGPNSNVDCSGARGAEANIIGLGGANNVAVKFTSDNVTLNGFTISNPTGNIGVSEQGRSNIIVNYNIITNIGNNVNGSGPSDGIQIESSATASNVNLTYNCISNIRGGQNGASNSANGSGIGVGVNSSNSTFDLSDLTISNNRISSISACTTNGTGGKGAYGVIVGVGKNTSFNGKTINTNVSNNTVDGLNGRWAHGVGLEGNSQGATVTNNDIKNLMSVAGDAVGVTLEDNAFASSVLINQNSFTNTLFGVGNAMSAFVDATCNWYGVSDYASVAPKVVGNVTNSPWLTSGGNSASIGFSPTGLCNGTPIVISSVVPTDIHCGPTTGSILVSWTGGLSNYTVAWTGASSGSASAITVGSYSITPLLAGSYSFTVTDANGSTATSSAIVQYLPVTNVTNTTYYANIQAAINASLNGDVLAVCAGTYTETISLNKNVTLNGPNSGIAGTAVRSAEAVLQNGTINVSASGVTVIDGFYIDQTDSPQDVILLSGPSQSTVQNCVFNRHSSTTGNTVRGVTTSAGAGAKAIQNNYFTGDANGGLFSGHKSWNNCVYINGAASTVSISNNYFEKSRTALSLDDFNNGITVSGNTFDNCGTFMGFGGTTATNGQYVLDSNDFKNPADAIINLSNVNVAFRLDITSSTLNGAVFNTLPLATLFNVEAGMYHRGRSGRNGLVYFVTANEYVYPSLTTIQSASNYGAAGDTVNVKTGTYTEQVEIIKNLIVIGEGIGNTNIISPNTLTLSFVTTPNTNKPIVYIHDAANVEIKNLTVDGAGKGNANARFIGVAYRNAGGTLRDCEIKTVRNTPLDGSQHGVGIYAFADNGTARILNISKNTIYDFQKNATSLNGADLTANVDSNTVTGAGALGSGKPAQNGIQVSFGAAGSITNNTISNINYTPITAASCGILVFQASGTTLVSNNTVTDCQSSIAIEYCDGYVSDNIVHNNSVNMGASAYWWLLTIESGTMSVTNNDFDGGGNGVAIDAYSGAGETTSITVSNNAIVNCETGIATEHSSSGTVSGPIQNNSITSSSTALYNDQTAYQNSTCNWFGVTDDASITALLSGNVTYSPWLTNGTDDDLVTTGFQPVSGSCGGTPVVISSAAPTHILCGPTTGSILVSWTGGLSNYTVAWTGASSGSASAITVGSYSITPLLAGSYSITVTDANGSTATSSAIVQYLPVTNVTNTSYYASIQAAIAAATSGDEIDVCAGTYTEVGQIVIDKDLSIVGADKTTTVIMPSSNTTNGGNVQSESFIYIDPAATVSLSNFTIDCNGKLVHHGIQSRGNLTVDNCIIQNVRYGDYAGRGIVFYSGTSQVTNTSFTNIERIGIHVRGGVTTPLPVVDVSGCTYTGKGSGTWLDYAVEFGGGGSGSISGSTFTNCKGLAYDGSTSAGILATTYFGPGTSATITNNFINDNTDGIVVGYDGADVSAITAHDNDLSGNTSKAITSTAPAVNATCNWYGVTDNASILNYLGGSITYSTWLTNGTDFGGDPTDGFQPVPGSCNGSPVVISSADPVHIHCGDPSGFILVTFSGGVAPYDIAWTGGSANGISSPYSITGLLAGNYTITVIDANNSTATASATVLYLPVANTTQGTFFATIHAAINDGTTVNGDNIEVCQGTYNENIVVGKSLTLKGANYGVSCSGARGAETIINGTAGSGSKTISVEADNVIINGFKITNPLGSFGIYAKGRNSSDFQYNIITDIGNNTSGSGASYGVAIEMGSTTDISDVTVSNNCVNYIRGGQNTSLTGVAAKANNGSAVAIGSGFSTAIHDVSTLTISGNLIDHITSCIDTFTDGGKGAYGVLINVGASAAGKAVSPLVSNNEITILEGLWSHGIGLEGKTPGASVINNYINNLIDHKGNTDAIGVMLEDNNGVATTGIHENSFTNMVFAIKNTTVQTVDATCNWYGTVGSGAIATLVSGNITYSPYLLDGTDDQPATTGFQSSATCGTVTELYVDDNNDAGDVYTLGATGDDSNPGTASAPFRTIQYAINAASAGNIIWVDAGTYTEEITVNKSVIIKGSNADIDACAGSRVAEAVIYPAISDIADNVDDGIFSISPGTSYVTINGFTLDGDNTSLTSGYLGTNGADIDAAHAVSRYGTGNNLVVTNNIMKNFSYFAVAIYDYPAAVPSAGNVVSNNKIQDLGTYDNASGISFWGGGVLIYNNQYTAVSNNCMTNVRIGIQTGNFHNANPGSSAYQLITGNTIQARRRGIFHNLFNTGASPYTISGNTITGLADANETASWDGILLSSLATTVHTTSNNLIDGSAITGIPTTGIVLWNDQMAPLISGDTISGVGLGINVNNFEGYPTSGSNADNTFATIDGVTVTGATIAGVKVNDNPLNTNGATVSAEVKNSTISGCTTGVLVSGSDASANIHDNGATINGALIGIDVDGGSAAINTNKIISNGTGVWIHNSGDLTSASNNFINSNTNDGILIASDAGTIGSISNNDLSGNGVGSYDLNNGKASSITPTCNWFGSNVPATVALRKSGSMTYIPYLSTGTDDGNADNGFQPQASCTGSCPLSITSIDETPASCYGISDGSLTVNITGAISPSHSWTSSPVQTTQTATWLAGSVAGTNYTVTVTDVNGCTATDNKDVFGPAQVSATITGGATVCSDNNTVHLSVDFTNGFAPWTFVYNNDSVTTSDSPYDLIVSPSVTTTYTLSSVQDNNGCVGVVSGSSLVTVNPAVYVSAGPDQEACSLTPTTASPVQLAGSITGGISTGAWTGGLGNFNPNSNSPTAIYTPDPSEIGTTVTLTLTSDDPDGVGPCSSKSDDVKIKINEVATISTDLADNDICVNGSGTLIVLVGGSTTSVDFVNIDGGGFIDNYDDSGFPYITAEYHPVPGDIGNIVHVTATTNDPDGAGPCTGVFTVFNISVIPAPTVAISLTTPDTICKGGSATLKFSFTGVPPFTYQYSSYDLDNSIYTDFGPFTVTPPGVGPYYVITVPVTSINANTIYYPTDVAGSNVVSCSGFSVQDSAQVQVNIETNPPTGATTAGTANINACKPTQLEANAAFDAIAAGDGYSDDCGQPVTATMDSAIVDGINCNWTVTYYFTVYDENGNALNGQSYVNVGGDVTAPSLTGTAYAQVGSVDACQPTQAAAEADFSSADALTGYTDNCSGGVTATLINTDVIGTNCSWTITYTYTVKDACNNALANQTYTTVGGDVTAPSLTGTAYAQVGSVDACQPTQAAAEADFSSADALTGYTDNCSGGVTATLINTDVIGTNCSWTITYTYTVKDACNNALANQTYTTVGGDVTAPSLTGTAYAQVGSVDACQPTQAAAEADFSSADALTGYTDNCSGGVTATLINTDVIGTNCSWTITYTYTVKDACNNALANQTYTTVGGDVTAPSLTGTAYAQVGSVDACQPTQAAAEADFSSADALTGYTDNCSGGVTATLINTDVIGTNCSWTITYTYTVKDACNNALANQTYTTVGGDVTAPSLTGTAYAQVGSVDACQPTQAAAEADFSSADALTGYTDNCSGGVTATLINTDVIGTNCSWTITYTYTVKDACNNALANQTYTTVGGDVTAPSLTGTAYAQVGSVDACQPTQAAAEADFSSADALTGYTDNCSGGVTATLINTDVIGTNCSWTITYTYTVKDACNNALANQTYTTVGGDVTAPSLTGTAYAQVGSVDACQPTQAAAEADFSSADALAGYTDNCSGGVTATLINTDVIGTNCSWTITYTYTVKDACNNALANQTYTTVGGDVTAPSLTGTAYAQVGSVDACQPTQAAAEADFSSADALTGYTDNCSGGVTATLINTDVIGTNCSWTITYTYTVKDACNNALANQTYTTVGGDVTAPSLTGTAYAQVGSVDACQPTQAAAEADFSSADALTGYTDNCSGGVTATLINTDVIGTNCSWTITYTYTVKDACNNALANQTYTTVGGDVTAPSLTGTAYAQVGSVDACQPTQAAAEADFSSADALTGYTDNCSGGVTATLINTDVIGTNCSWTITYTYTVKDACNNALANQTYTTVGGDVTAPSLTGTAYAQVGSVDACQPTQAAAEADFSSADALTGYTDNCSGGVTATLINTDVIGTNCSWTITYTYTVKDACNNALANQTYTTVGGDVTAPSLTGTAYAQVGSVDACQPTQAAAEADFSSADALTGYTDNCSGGVTATLINTDVIGTNCSWTITYTYTVKDACNNALANQTYTTVGGDVTAPSLTGTAYAQVGSVDACQPTQAAAEADFSSADALTGYTDNCSGGVTATLINTDVIGTNCSWTITYTYTVKDACNNALANQTYTTVGGDVTAPSLTGTAYAQVGSVDACQPTQAAAEADFSSADALTGYTDNCSGGVTATLINTDVIGTNCSWTITYTYTVKDACNNALANQTYTTVGGDVTAPSLTGTAYAQVGSVDACQPTQAAAEADFSSADALTGYTDNCSGGVTATLINTDVIGTNCSWTITYTYTVKDACNNALANQTYTTVGGDVTAPSLTGTAYAQVGSVDACQPTQAAAEADFSSADALTGYTDNCSGGVTATLINTDVIGTNCSWTITYTYTVKDACNNALANQTYTTVGGDVTAPSLTGTAYAQVGSVDACQPTQAAAEADFSSADALTGYTDNCSGGVTATLINTDVIGTNCSWTITYTYTVKDACNNALANQTYTTVGGDVTAPSLTGTAYAQVGSVDACQPTQAAAEADFSSADALTGYTDNCSGGVTATLINTDVIGTNCSWTITYTYTVKDACNNALANQTYTTVGGDVTAPSLTGTAYAQVGSVDACQPTQAAAEADFSSADALTGYTDNCSGGVTATLINTDVIGTNCSWTITYTYTVKDACNNALANQTYTTVGGDVTAPSLTGTAYAQVGSVDACQPTQAAAEADFSSADALTGYTDNCSGGVTATLINTDVIGTNCSWTITYTYTVKDACNNALANQTYTTVGGDVTAPTFTFCPANTIINCQDDTSIATRGDATATDNCSSATITHNDVSTQGTNPANSNYYNYTITRTFTATDACDNANSSCVQVITVQDVTKPVISDCPSSFIAPRSCAGAVSYTTPTALDNCSGVVTPVITPAWAVSGASFPVGTTSVKYVFTDPSGNKDSCMFDVTINELTASASSPTYTGGKNIKCNGESNGSISLAISNAAGTPSYLWSPGGATVQNVSGLVAGTYSVTVTDGACSTTASITLTQPDPLTLNATKTDVTCNGDADGTATAIVVGGSSPYNYSWNSGQTTITATGLTPGTYTVTLTDVNGCASVPTTKSVVITQPNVLNATTSKTDVKCKGASTGAANATVSGGTTPYTYLWSSGQTTPNINSLTEGVYNLTITDANGCTKVISVTINEPAAVLAVTISNGGVHALTANPTGGTPFPSGSPYTYLWSPGGKTTQTATGLNAGTIYTVTVTDKNGCKAFASMAAPRLAEEPSITVAPLFNADVFPNPTMGDLTVRFDAPSNEHYTISLFDDNGRIVFDKSGTSAEGENNIRLNLTNLAKGIYFVRVVNDQQFKVIRVVLQ